MSRSIRVRLLAVLFLLAVAAPVRADLPPGPSPRRPDPLFAPPGPPQPLKVLPDGSAVPDPFPPRPEPRRRTGPFRSCGSGAGTGLAAIGVSWGLLWLGTRFAGRVRATKG